MNIVRSISRITPSMAFNRRYVLHISDGGTTLCGRSIIGWDEPYRGIAQPSISDVVSDNQFCRVCRSVLRSKGKK